MRKYVSTLMRYVGALAMVWILVISMACALSQSQIDRATKASGNIANYTGTVIATVKTLYESGAIKIEIKDLAAQKLKDFSIAGGDFNRLVASVSKQYGNGTVPVAVWRDLVTHFDALVKVFVDILSFIPQAAGLQDSKAFKIITAAVLTIANILISVGYSKPMYRKLNNLVPNWQSIQREVDNYELA